MKVLVTGHDGYIGCVLVPMLQKHGHEVVGLDSGLFIGCEFEDPALACETIRADVRDVPEGELVGFEIDVARRLASDAGLEIEFVPTAWDGIIPGLLAGKRSAHCRQHAMSHLPRLPILGRCFVSRR